MNGEEDGEAAEEDDEVDCTKESLLSIDIISPCKGMDPCGFLWFCMKSTEFRGSHKYIKAPLILYSNRYALLFPLAQISELSSSVSDVPAGIKVQ